MAVNGIPFWYFYRLEGPWEDYRIESVDPRGEQWEKIGPERVIGCVIYPAAEVSEPGVIRHIDGNRFSIGEPSGEKTERVTQLSELLRNAGLKSPRLRFPYSAMRSGSNCGGTYVSTRSVR